MQKVNMSLFLLLADESGAELRFQKGDFVEIKIKHTCMYEKDPNGGYDIPVRLVKGKLIMWNDKNLEIDVSHDYCKETVSFHFDTIESIKITDNKKRTSYYA